MSSETGFGRRLHGRTRKVSTRTSPYLPNQRSARQNVSHVARNILVLRKRRMNTTIGHGVARCLAARRSFPRRRLIFCRRALE
jgi:hypothetical protein